MTRAFAAASIFLWIVLSFSQEVSAKDDVRSVAFFGFRLINTTLTPSTEDELQRLKLLDKIIDEKLVASGRYTTIPIPEDMRSEIAKGPDFGSCSCEADYAKRLDADLVGWGTVQKVSNLILNINVYIADVKSNNYVFVKSVDIRSNDDTSWTKGLRWMLRYYLDDVK